MGGGGGNSFLGSMMANIGNPNARNGRWALNLFDPGGVMATLGEQTGSSDVGAIGGQVTDEPNAPDIVPSASEATVKADEAARLEEQRKRRLRTKTLLTNQEDAGMATVGTKTLLGG